MRRRIAVFHAALADLDSIYDYIARDNPRAAADLLRDLDSSIQLLAHQPRLGRRYPFRGMRLLPHGHYLIFYRERPSSIEFGSSMAEDSSRIFSTSFRWLVKTPDCRTGCTSECKIEVVVMGGLEPPTSAL
ncbi:MAG: type II toxin-antitoxin system RelE/ParE family toxin [Proteobacteria bacterium]|nr:MAG: type II toxin-antitoxin system RelE/ParE family toxin [Pseudomonadota bacterium]MBC6946228.1 type II toxin-antitoxin system RelE/ParE family toxin [Gammaproteobacteria bacterium]MCE7896406.1 type II toxin-antitoxin system RelE/ParE family toxin [Gammaproteobacteria bacterium PRO8]MCQ3934902.1 hypothetical protein [Gammaproteobacteria bacterium]MDL1881934.1 type II toxin-antitoxin system RelE/ParE family toxin [Gammaproteobacteria bacterium PRO2]